MLKLTPAIIAACGMVLLSGCVFDPAPDLIDRPASKSAGSSSSVAPVDPESYTSKPVPTGLLADMLMLGGELYEPHDNWWNTKVKDAPLDPNSDAIIATIAGYDATGGQLHPDFSPTSGIPYCIVDENTPLVPVTFDDPSESDAGAPGAPAGYPIPQAANTDPGYLENGGGPDGDGHLLIFDKDSRTTFELYRAQYANGHWSAGCGAVFKLDVNYRRPDNWTSADASGLCMLAGLVRHDEVYGLWAMKHALRVSLPYTNGHVYPASHTGATDAGAPPLGMRLRLKKNVDISRYPMYMRKIFTCMKTYGLIVTDRGSNMYIQGTMDPAWDNSVLNPIFRDFHVTDFEVIQLGWNPAAP